MLVGGSLPQPLENLLLETGSSITKLASGKTAVSYIHRQMFDSAIIVSTGEDMDLAETVFNLRDINGSMEVIILDDSEETKNREIPNETVARLVENAKVMNLQQLEKHFQLASQDVQ